MKTLVAGLDAACWEYVQPLLAAGEMPALAALMAQGAWGRLDSTMPPWTPAAWATISTGKNPGKHGIFDMLWRDPATNTFAPTSAALRRGTPFWQRLNEAGLRVGLVNVPFTYPPAAIDGFVVAGFGSPEGATDIAYPAAAAAWLRQHEPGHGPVVSAALLNSGDPELILQEETAHQEFLVRCALGLSQLIPVDVLVINLMLTDHANHKMPDMQRIQEAYRRSDRHLQQLLDGFRPESVMLLSDHGSSRLHGEFLLVKWLRERGYLALSRRTAAERSAALNWLLALWLQQRGLARGFLEAAARRLLLGAAQAGPAGLGERFLRRLEADLPGALDHLEFSDAPDLQLSLVLPGSVYSGLLYLNDRYPAGERAARADLLVGELKELQEPEADEPLFTAVYRADELYGEATDGAPDIILDAFGGDWNVRALRHTPRPGRSKVDGYFASSREYGDFGWHSKQGLFVFAGDCFTSGEQRTPAELADVPATLLYLYGVAQPDDLDGRVLREVLAAEASERPLRYQPGDAAESAASPEGLTAEEAGHVLEHLKALGYLE